MEVFEAMETARAMRYLKPDPVPDELIQKVLYYATRASSPGNSQGWDFVVVRDPARRKRIGDLVRETMGSLVAQTPLDGSNSNRLLVEGGRHLLDTFGDAPALIFVTGKAIYPDYQPREDFIPAATYPATQNLIVAARALGVGTTLTLFHMMCEPQIREIIGLPSSHKIEITIPMGWPDKKFGPVNRKPLDEVVHWERFGAHAPDASRS